MIIKQNSKLEN